MPHCRSFVKMEESLRLSEGSRLRAPTDTGRSRGGKTAPAAETADETEPQEVIRCKNCGEPITTPADRISVQGAHAHTFANPHGIVFHIGCFRSVRGCSYAGSPSVEFSWFSGFAWRIALCRGCLIHLGWLFSSGGEERFHGLILDRLADGSI